MRRNLLLLVALLVSSCAPAASVGTAPVATPSAASLPATPTVGVSVTLVPTRAPATPVPATATALPAVTVSPTASGTAAATRSSGGPFEVHQTLGSGLTFDAYALQGAPTLDAFDFTPVNGTRADIVARHQKDGGAIVPPNLFYDSLGPGMTTTWQGQTLTAREVFTNNIGRHGVVQVRAGDRLIMTAPIGDISPIDTLRRLMTFDGHWLLETAYVELGKTSGITWTGQIFEDGQLLNTRAGYQEAFGLQLLRGKLFYFYRRDGVVGASYDGQETPLGYDSVPHYGCCSGALLNPVARENRVSFFAQKGDAWYYGELGVYAGP